MEKLKTVNIKGKEYVEVNERIKYFRKNYKGYRIVTELIQYDTDTCLMRASVLDENGNVISTGHAYEKADSSFINKTSYVENCETSAIGRALGLFGIGIDASIASYEEVANAIEQQGSLHKKTNVQGVSPNDRGSTTPPIDQKKQLYSDAQAKIFKLAKDKNLHLDLINDFGKAYGVDNLKKFDDEFCEFMERILAKYNSYQYKLLLVKSQTGDPVDWLKEMKRQDRPLEDWSDGMIDDELAFGGYYDEIKQ